MRLSWRQNGTYTVSPATLTYVANAASRAAGDLSPAFSGTVTGFVNSDTQASVDHRHAELHLDRDASQSRRQLCHRWFGSHRRQLCLRPGGRQCLGADHHGLQPAPDHRFDAGADRLHRGASAATAQSGQHAAGRIAAQSDRAPGGAAASATAGGAPPPVQSPLADNNSEQPTSSDQTTTQVADSLNGERPRIGAGAHGGGVVIPKFLVNAHPPVPPPTDISALSSFGNSSLWQ